MGVRSQSRFRAPRLAAPAVLLAAALWPQAPGAAQGTAGGTAVVHDPPVADEALAFLESQVASGANNASVWRLLGRAYWQRRRLHLARAAFLQALQADPDSPAANFDYARFLRAQGEDAAAAKHFRRVIELAPGSDYAAQAKTCLAQLSESGENSEVVQAGYEIRRFDGSEQGERHGLPEEVTAADQPFSLRLELGAVFNSNVALSPISRELVAGDRASAQGFLAPQMEYRLVNREDWRFGPAFAGHFTLNENNFEHFNLQSYRPGVFLEHSRLWGPTILTPRIQYDFTHDEFDGNTFGNRHAVTFSTLLDWNARHNSFVYWSVDRTNFLRDGQFPEVSSQDGWTHLLGASHTLYTDYRYLYSVTAGVDVQWAETTGSNFTYRGVSLYAATVIPLAETWTAELQAGWGYRDYPNFLFTPSRNEHIWRAGAELRKRLSDHVSLSGVFNFDRFVSRNDLFDAERFVTGLVLTFEY